MPEGDCCVRKENVFSFTGVALYIPQPYHTCIGSSKSLQIQFVVMPTK